ncbi:MAG: hypothetical protein CVV06_06315 [Gammaproteobacteria bacterium HGW-Gammaproteobacteria-10]|nr:MAG: hypothetical protein CVV06_06315 [Gammaproteobacteria bacterium HGW-Gammaproteobacteria-10]
MQEQLPRSKNLPCRRRLSIEQPHPLRNQHYLCRAPYIEKLDKELKSTNFHITKMMSLDFSLRKE